MPQNNWAPITMSSSSFRAGPADRVDQIWAGGTQCPARLRWRSVWIAKVIPISSTQPAKRETRIDITMPRGPLRSRVVRLLGHVRGGVVAGEGVLRQQQADRRMYHQAICASRTVVDGR